MFQFLLATSGVLALLMYLVIAVTQLRMRRKLVAMGKRLEVRMWLFPWLTLLTIVFIIGIFAMMAIFSGQNVQLLSKLALKAFLIAAGGFLQEPVRTLGPRRHASGHTLYM
ncbi:hypothetical protein ACIQVE_28290 [Pseudomonas sp. NPDC098747]|uniref:hypothetical protein n=1 Tax=Pseudomonas sp. NPDC098747 TaxID=3364487 RepID=UPI00383B9C99